MHRGGHPPDATPERLANLDTIHEARRSKNYPRPKRTPCSSAWRRLQTAPKSKTGSFIRDWALSGPL